MSKINLGDKVKDSVTGFTGIVVGRTTWLHGCDRLIVQPEGINKEGKIYDNNSFDEPQLVLVKKAKTKEGDHSTGGPRETPIQKSGVSRY